MAEYQVNKDYITEAFCVNKNNVKLQCNGKCHLTKELKAADNHEKKHHSPVKEKMEVLYFCATSQIFSFFFPTVFVTGFRSFSDSELLSPVIPVFQPPKILA